MTPKPTLLMLPPQTVTTRAWAARLGAEVPELSIVVAEDDDAALKEIAGADAAGRAARGILLPGADRAPRCRHEFPGDLQRPHRRPHHGLRARVRAGVS